MVSALRLEQERRLEKRVLRLVDLDFDKNRYGRDDYMPHTPSKATYTLIPVKGGRPRMEPNYWKPVAQIAPRRLTWWEKLVNFYENLF